MTERRADVRQKMLHYEYQTVNFRVNIGDVCCNVRINRTCYFRSET